jgi:triosephosphate isomerase (TIM)
MYKIIANWKMYLDIQESRNLAAQVASWWDKTAQSGGEFIICPSTLALHDVRQQLDGTPISLGAQDLSLSPVMGAFTGQIPGQHLHELDIKYAIVGHSEMRKFYGVTDEMVSNQVAVALAHNITPIICIGETKEERDEGRTDQVVLTQIKDIMGSLKVHDHEICIAYEPRWAIGTGRAVESAEAQRVHQQILRIIKEHTHQDVSRIHILYGGSVDASNIADFLTEPSIDGVLIGSASANTEKLSALIQAFDQMFQD